MSNRRILFIVGATLLCALVAMILVSGEKPSSSEPRQQPRLARSTDQPPVAEKQRVNESVVKEEDAATKIGKVSVKMSNAEFSHLRVSLPAPANKPWKGPFYDSQTCFDEDKKLAAVEVLPIWMRKAMLAGETEMAARYLWSYLRFTDDKKPEVAMTAVVSLYRMGDYNDTALGKMRQWVESDFASSYLDAAAATSDRKDIRQQVLAELAFANDKRLNDVILEVWSKNQSSEGKELASVDYGYFLENHGRELPSEYWVGRLDKPYGFENALEVAQKRSSPELTAKLQGIFEELHARPAATPDASRAASVASALFRQTGDGRYRDYLAEQARAQLASGSFESSLSKVLVGLATTNDKAALEIVATAMHHDNEVVREMAIDALGSSHDPAATELLFEAATKKAKQGKGFPARELRALLAQDDPRADSKYGRLQQSLVSGQLGWSATTSDFEALEFFRKHGRR